jgi:8-oxo-dGTP pyrophosphatase MutT (NUDIX family)
MKTRVEISAGGVVYRSGDEGIEICLAARRTRRGDLAWGLPKGVVELDEAPETAALREVAEETGLEAEIERDLGTVRYFYVWQGVRVRKQVRFFLMRATGGDVASHDDEMEDVRWFGARSAIKRTSYRGERELVERAVEIIS